MMGTRIAQGLVLAGAAACGLFAAVVTWGGPSAAPAGPPGEARAGGAGMPAALLQRAAAIPSG
ncbi:hypothetical protein CKO45_15160, partial [Paracraurococcus ruber]|nr:hypothetical protein [Paracraurococcus ruber]